MMRTEDCVVVWIQNCIEGVEGKVVRANSCHGQGETFYSYSTPIAKYYPYGKRFVINPRKYSVTTSKLQNYIRRHLSGMNVSESEGLR